MSKESTARRHESQGNIHATDSKIAKFAQHVLGRGLPVACGIPVAHGPQFAFSPPVASGAPVAHGLPVARSLPVAQGLPVARGPSVTRSLLVSVVRRLPVARPLPAVCQLRWTASCPWSTAPQPCSAVTGHWSAPMAWQAGPFCPDEFFCSSAHCDSPQFTTVHDFMGLHDSQFCRLSTVLGQLCAQSQVFAERLQQRCSRPLSCTSPF